MKQTPMITIPATTINKLAAIGRAMLALAEELKQQTGRPYPFLLPKLKRPAHIPEDQAWFWSDKWQKGEQEVNTALAQGGYQEFETMEEAIAELHRQV